MEWINWLSDLFQKVISNLILCFLALITLFEVIDQRGGNIPWFSYNKRKREREFLEEVKRKTSENIKDIYEREYQFLIDHEKERIGSFLVQLGLKRDQFTEVKLKILEFQRLPMTDISAIKSKLEKLCIDSLVMVDQRKFLQRKYNEVGYYLNFVDIMYSPCSRDISYMLANLIQTTLRDKIDHVDRVVVTTEGNFLLGLKISELLRIPMVKMRRTERILEKQFWDGNFESNEKVIIVHDALVTAKQVTESINLFPYNVDVIGLFCLVRRTEWDGKEKLNEMGIETHSVIDICDADIEKLMQSA